MIDRARLPRNVFVALAACLFCLYVFATLLTPAPRSSRLDSKDAQQCVNRPQVCGHRVVGDEAASLGIIPTQAMATLFKRGVQCFDGDVIRLADGTLYMAHPLMFMPFLEHITQQNMEGLSTEAVLLLAQNLTEADMVRAGPEMPDDVVRPVKLQAVLEQYASLLSEYGFSTELPAEPKPPASPWLFLEPKHATYTTTALATLWRMVEALHLERRVAIWAMDGEHHDVLMRATDFRAHTIWAYMDREFSDQISTVPYPAPWPPAVQAVPRLDMFGIAKQAAARWATDTVQPAMVALWLMDDVEDFHAACIEGADLVITNRPLMLLDADI